MKKDKKNKAKAKDSKVVPLEAAPQSPNVPVKGDKNGKANPNVVNFNASNPGEDKPVKPNYDTIARYKEIIEQNVVDGLFDYFGRVYYNIPDDGKTVYLKNEYQSYADRKKVLRFRKTVVLNIILFVIFAILTTASMLCIHFLVGWDFANAFEAVNNNKVNGVIAASVWSVAGLMSLLTLVFIVAIVIFNIKSSSMVKKNRVNLKHWNSAFSLFADSLESQEIHNSIELAFSYLAFDKATPSYDKRIYALHNRLYVYGDIPKDARRIEFKNVLSGFYKNNSFTLSYSKWEWYREAKEILESRMKNDYEMSVTAQRKLHRFSDSILLLTMDVDANPKLNFILNNYAGRNVKLNNTTFNKIFNLVVSDPITANEIFTPFVQHTYMRLKTWSTVSKMIRQVIKEGSKVYVIADGVEDFFTFNRITDPFKSIVFNTSYKNGADIKVGSLNESASLMTEYILEEVDLLYTMLEFGANLPVDPNVVALKNANKLKEAQAKARYNSLADSLSNRNVMSSSAGLDSFAEEQVALNRRASEVARNRVWADQNTPRFARTPFSAESLGAQTQIENIQQ